MRSLAEGTGTGAHAFMLQAVCHDVDVSWQVEPAAECKYHLNQLLFTTSWSPGICCSLRDTALPCIVLNDAAPCACCGPREATVLCVSECVRSRVLLSEWYLSAWGGSGNAADCSQLASYVS